MQTEDEQLAQLKEWWQRNGKPLMFGAVVALAAVLAWQAWQRYQVNQEQGASALYQQLLDAALQPDQQGNTGRVVELSESLNSEYGGTPYAQYARLFVAKSAVETGKLDDAALELRTVMDDPESPVLGELARQRLARVLAAQDKSDEALALLNGDAPAGFASTREELRGDLLVRLGRADDAHAAYQKAKDSLSDDAAVGGLQMKLDDLAKGDA